MPTIRDKETRACLGIELREAPEDSPYIGILEGYAAVFDSDSVPLPGYPKEIIERVERSAFKRTLKESPDVRALWNHRTDAIIGRAPNTLSLTEDERGLKVSVNLVDTTLNRDLLTQVRNGIVDAMSFGFRVIKDSWRKDKAEEYDHRTLEDVELYEVSPVVWPAYPDTSIAVRSQEQFHRELEAEEAARRAEEAKQAEEAAKEPEEPFAPKRDAWRARLGGQTTTINKNNDE